MATGLVQLGSRPPVEGPEGLLLECHERIRRFVGLAAEVGARPELPAPEVVDACERCARYFREALPLHVEDEEASVRPRLAGAGPEVASALAQMHDEHAAHEPLLAALLAALSAVRLEPGDRVARGRLLEAASALRAAFEPHLAREERVIVPALRRLSDGVRAELVSELRARRQPGSPKSP